jgi:hypothetical protein
MDTNGQFSEPVLAGSLLILSGLIFLPGAALYFRSAIWKRAIGANPVYRYWERGFVIAAVVVAGLGFVLLEKILEAAGDPILAPLGLATLFLSIGLILIVETYSISKQEWLYAPTVVHVVLAFLAQAAFGASLVQTSLLPGWVGWATIIWNLGLLVYLPVFKPREIYYPFVYYVAPILIGIMLLSGR